MTVLIFVGVYLLGLIGGWFFRIVFERKDRATGTIIVSKDEGKTTYTLELNGDVEEVLGSSDAVLFVVRH